MNQINEQLEEIISDNLVNGKMLNRSFTANLSACDWNKDFFGAENDEKTFNLSVRENYLAVC